MLWKFYVSYRMMRIVKGKFAEIFLRFECRLNHKACRTSLVVEAYSLFSLKSKYRQKAYAIRESEKKNNEGLHTSIPWREWGHIRCIYSDRDHPLTNKVISTVTFKVFVETLKASLNYKLLKALIKKKKNYLYLKVHLSL